MDKNNSVLSKLAKKHEKKLTPRDKEKLRAAKKLMSEMMKEIAESLKPVSYMIKESQRTHPNEWNYLETLLDEGNPEKRYLEKLYSAFRRHIVKVAKYKGFEKGDIYIKNDRLYSKRIEDPDPEDIMTEKFEAEWKRFDLSDFGKFPLRVCDAINTKKKPRQKKLKLKEKEHSVSCICPECMTLLWSKDYKETKTGYKEDYLKELENLIDSFAMDKILEDYLKETEAGSRLTDRQKQVIDGLHRQRPPSTKTELAKELNIDESAVRRHEKAAIKKIKTFLSSKLSQK